MSVILVSGGPTTRCPDALRAQEGITDVDPKIETGLFRGFGTLTFYLLFKSVILSLSKDQPPGQGGRNRGGSIRDRALPTAGMPRKLILRQG